MRTTTNYLLVGDVHLADVPPASRKDGYKEEVLDLLSQTVEKAREHDAVAVWAGDVFHLKTPGRNSFRLVHDVIDIVEDYPRELFIVPGNHDLTHDRLDSLPSQPLGMLFRAGAVELTDESGFDHGYAIYGVPWLQRYTDEAVRNAFEYWHKCLEGVPADWEENSLVVTHAPLYPPGRELPYEFYDATKWASAMGNHGSVFYGHVHNPHGVYSVGGVQFCNNGALSRGSLDESNLTRDVVATLWSDISGEFRTIPLNYQPATEIFRMEEQAKKQAQVILDDFLESIGQTSIAVTTTDSVMEYVRGLGIGEHMESLIKHLLETV